MKPGGAKKESVMASDGSTLPAELEEKRFDHPFGKPFSQPMSGVRTLRSARDIADSLSSQRSYSTSTAEPLSARCTRSPTTSPNTSGRWNALKLREAPKRKTCLLCPSLRWCVTG